MRNFILVMFLTGLIGAILTAWRILTKKFPCEITETLGFNFVLFILQVFVAAWTYILLWVRPQ